MQRTVRSPQPLPNLLENAMQMFRNPKFDCGTETIPVLGPEASAEDFTIGSTIQSKKTNQYLNLVTASTSFKPVVFGATGDTTAWGLEGDTIITVQGSSFGRREYSPFYQFQRK
jgi:hypothetical protein